MAVTRANKGMGREAVPSVPLLGGTFDVEARFKKRPSPEQTEMAMRYGLLWLLGVPIPVLLLIFLLF